MVIAFLTGAILVSKAMVEITRISSEIVNVEEIYAIHSQLEQGRFNLDNYSSES